jgi:hypothetical protein
MKLPERHTSFIKGKSRTFYLLPIVWYSRSRKLRFRWPIRSVVGVHWSFYLKTNIKAFIFLPYMLLSNLYYFKESGFTYKEIDYDKVYGR